MSLYARGQHGGGMVSDAREHLHIVVRVEVDRVEVLDVGRDDAGNVAPGRARVAGHAPGVAL